MCRRQLIDVCKQRIPSIEHRSSLNEASRSAPDKVRRFGSVTVGYRDRGSARCGSRLEVVMCRHRCPAQLDVIVPLERHETQFLHRGL
jgi:hypothetical protein